MFPDGWRTEDPGGACESALRVFTGGGVRPAPDPLDALRDALVLSIEAVAVAAGAGRLVPAAAEDEDVLR